MWYIWLGGIVITILSIIIFPPGPPSGGTGDPDRDAYLWWLWLQGLK